jgi:predicted CoA-binding protein
MLQAEEILKTKKVFAVVGANQDPEKYGHEVLSALVAGGCTVFPINPKYGEIDDIKCYGSLKELSEKPDVVISALAPGNTERMVPQVKEFGVEILWMPPGCWSEAAIEACQKSDLKYLHDVCPVGSLEVMRRPSIRHRSISHKEYFFREER